MIPVTEIQADRSYSPYRWRADLGEISLGGASGLGSALDFHGRRQHVDGDQDRLAASSQRQRRAADDAD
jgi:hypothetical protein